ncbi:MAG: ATP-dependent helicase, partial [Rhodothermales bacterium]
MARRFILREHEGSAREYSIDYHRELNEQQHAAVTAPAGSYLVIAGAGTGKTRTLIYRVAYLVESEVSPENILLLTFTRRAAREMLLRAADLLDGRCSRVRGGTFHSFCVSVLRRHAERIGFTNNFSILDASDAADVLDILRSERGFHRSDKRFPRKNTLQAIFSTVWNRAMRLEEVIEKHYPQFADHHESLHLLAQDFEAYKIKYGLMDYDDLLRRTLELFERHDAIRRKVATSCRYVLVDEYQDTNAMQAALVRAFSSVHGNVMAVGDDAQSIYRFRGADYRNIFDFPKQFQDVSILKLEHNYRSTQPILDLANHVLGKAARRYDKNLFSDKKQGERPAIVAAADEQEEAQFVAQMILHLREEGRGLEDMAVLFRSSYNSFELEVELGRRSIPYVKYGGLKLSEAAHVKDVTAYLRVADNRLDAVAWNRILQLIRGIGPRTAAAIIDQIVASGDAEFSTDEMQIPPKVEADLRRLFETLQVVARPETTVPDQIEHILSQYAPIMKDVYADDFPKREQDLDHLVGLAAGYSSRAEFLAALTLDAADMTALDTEATDEDERPLVLSTIHSAKGLEFDAVFLIRTLEGVLPSTYALNDTEALDEELRLLYVALTRARHDLFVSYPVLQHRRGIGEYFAEPSRFVADVPNRLMEPIQLVRETDRTETRPPQLPDWLSSE